MALFRPMKFCVLNVFYSWTGFAFYSFTQGVALGLIKLAFQAKNERTS